MSSPVSNKEKRQHGSVMVPYSYYECRVPEYSPVIPLHWHSEFEINYIVSGKSEFVCGDERIVACEGDIIMLPPNMLHAIYPYRDFQQIHDTLVFREQMLGIAKEERCGVFYIEPIVRGRHRVITPISRGHNAYEEIHGSVRQIFACAKKNTPEADLYMKSELLRLIWLLEKNECVRTVKNTDDRHLESIRQVLRFISENYRDTISIEQLADMAHLSKSYFMYHFKQLVGIGAIEYVIQLRIKHACELLRTTSDTAAEIAFACGFQNLSNFNRQFKKSVGCTPGQYRVNV